MLTGKQRESFSEVFSQSPSNGFKGPGHLLSVQEENSTEEKNSFWEFKSTRISMGIPLKASFQNFKQLTPSRFSKILLNERVDEWTDGHHLEGKKWLQ